MSLGASASIAACCPEQAGSDRRSVFHDDEDTDETRLTRDDVRASHTDEDLDRYVALLAGTLQSEAG